MRSCFNDNEQGMVCLDTCGYLIKTISLKKTYNHRKSTNELYILIGNFVCCLVLEMSVQESEANNFCHGKTFLRLIIDANSTKKIFGGNRLGDHQG